MPSWWMVEPVRVMDDKADRLPPSPNTPSPPWLPTASDKVGCTPSMPVRRSMERVYTAPPEGDTESAPGMLPTALSGSGAAV